MRRERLIWTGVAIALAAIFYELATNGDVYGETSPPHVAVRVFGASGAVDHPAWISAHVVLRKLYSLVAFAMVGYATHRALGGPPGRVAPTALIVGAYSGLIEVGQYLHGYSETGFSRCFDVLCGMIGGSAGTVGAAWVQRRFFGHQRRVRP